jgi:hypothetical protein
VSQAGAGGPVTVSWKASGGLPVDVPLYRQIRYRNPNNLLVNGGMVPSDTLFAVLHNRLVAGEAHATRSRW